MSWRRGRSVLVGGGLASVLLVATSGAASGTSTTAEPSAPTGSELGADAGTGPVLTTEGVEVPTHGVVRFRAYQAQDGPDLVMAVHGVQRVEGGAVVYLSMGYEGGQTPPSPAYDEIVSTQIGGRYSGGGGLTSVRVVDTTAGEVLSTLREPGDGALVGALASPNTAFPQEPGTMHAAYAVVPELAEGTDEVAVSLGLGRSVVEVPVGEGLWEPAVSGEEPVVLGTGWPEVDLGAVAQAPEPELSRYPLTSVSQDLDGTTTTLEEPEGVTVDVAADVLFAQDSADLAPEARAVLEDVGAQVRERAVGGSVSVVGHTDSQAGDAYNQELSQRRAEAAAQVLGPVVEGAGLELLVEGRGESEPVADNRSEEGRQANRRVSVTFQTARTDEEGSR